MCLKGVTDMVRAISAVKGVVNPAVKTAKKQTKSTKNTMPEMLLRTKEGAQILVTSSMAMILPASSFLNKTEKYCNDGYTYRDGQWYEKHLPQDGSDYYHETPCEDPYKKPQYYPGS